MHVSYLFFVSFLPALLPELQFSPLDFDKLELPSPSRSISPSPPRKPLPGMSLRSVSLCSMCVALYRLPHCSSAVYCFCALYYTCALHVCTVLYVFVHYTVCVHCMCALHCMCFLFKVCLCVQCGAAASADAWLDEDFVMGLSSSASLDTELPWDTPLAL